MLLSKQAMIAELSRRDEVLVDDVICSLRPSRLLRVLSQCGFGSMFGCVRTSCDRIRLCNGDAERVAWLMCIQGYTQDEAEHQVRDCLRMHGKAKKYISRAIFQCSRLPCGDWSTAVQAKCGWMKFISECRMTGDRATARICTDVECGYPFDGGLSPKFFSVNRVWCLDRLEPRLPLATGGTSALLREISDRADRQHAHILVHVATDFNSPKVVAGVLQRRGGFTLTGSLNNGELVLERASRA